MVVPNDARDCGVVLYVCENSLADRWVFLHLPSLLKAKWARLFKQSGREPDFSNVMNEATKVGELLLLVG